MALSDPRSRRWAELWHTGVSPDDVTCLRRVFAACVEAGLAISAIAETAEVHPHDVRNFLTKTSVRPGHWPGLRMLHFAVNLSNDLISRTPGLHADVERLRTVAGRLAEFEPDADYFFHHLQRLDLTNARTCKRLTERLAGSYYAYRLSRRPGHIIRSHYELQPYNPFNRLPHVVNRLKYGPPDDDAALERTAECQLFQMADNLVLLGFVYRGYLTPGRRTPRGTSYDGIQVNVFPAGQFNDRRRPPIDGAFLSYVYDDHYEMGAMKLVPVTDPSNAKFDRHEVGEFPDTVIAQQLPALDLSSLRLDVTTRLMAGTAQEGGTASLLATCLSFVVTGERVSPAR